MKKSILVIFLYFHSISGDSIYGCTDPQKFHDANKHFFSEKIQTAAGRKDLLSMLIFWSKQIGKGGFGTVKTIDGVDEKFVLKMQNPEKIFDIMNVRREIRFLKQICGKNPDEVFDQFIDCSKSEVAAFRGCVRIKDSVVIFQQSGHSSLDKFEMLIKYRSFAPMKRIAVFLNILDLVIALHNKKIIHSDLKPANIVALDSELKELRLIDLGMAGTETKRFNGGTRSFLPPEVSPVFPSKKLAPQIDVYSLAITFMFLEAQFKNQLDKLDDACFKIRLTEDCHEKILKGVTKTLIFDSELQELKPIFFKALAYFKVDRYDTVEDFSKEIVENLKKIPNYECYFNEIRIEEEKQAQLNPKPLEEVEKVEDAKKDFKWMDYARELGYLAKAPETFEEEDLTSICQANLVPNPQTQPLQQQDEVKADENGQNQGEGAQYASKQASEILFPDEAFEDSIIEVVSNETQREVHQEPLKLQQQLNEKSSSSQNTEDQNQPIPEQFENEFLQYLI